MKFKPTVFTEQEVGCWIDGAFGQNHAREKLANMLRGNIALLSMSSYEMARDCLKALDSGIQSDDDWEIECATDILQHEFTQDGLVWLWEAGDLILTTEEQSQ